MAHERSATSISVYESLVIPGLLQTDDYARLLLRAIFPDVPQPRIERLVELRMAPVGAAPTEPADVRSRAQRGRTSLHGA